MYLTSPNIINKSPPIRQKNMVERADLKLPGSVQFVVGVTGTKKEIITLQIAGAPSWLLIGHQDVDVVMRPSIDVIQMG